MNLDTLIALLVKNKLSVSVAESCTGGGLSSLLTSISGSSVYFDRGCVTYSNQAKMDMLNVKQTTLDELGAVSEQTAAEMVRGVIKYSHSDIGVSTTGIAGPTGGTKNKPVGMVCFGFYVKGRYFSDTQFFKGSREKVVSESINFVINTLVNELSA